MKTRAGVIVGLLVVASCGTLRRGADPANVPSGSWVGQVVGTSFGPSRISGRVTLIPSAAGGTRMRAEIELRNVRHPSRHLWIVRRGSCGEANGAEVSSRAVPEIESRPDNTASLASQVDASLESGGAYSVIFLEGRTSNVIVGCATLVQQG